MKCERCGVETTGYNLHDYCATCSKNLCEKCMSNGCCGVKPAASGQAFDNAESEEAQRMAEDEIGIEEGQDG